jgi:hypothetical protein
MVLCDPGFHKIVEIAGLAEHLLRLGVGGYVSVSVVDSIEFAAAHVEIVRERD